MVVSLINDPLYVPQPRTGENDVENFNLTSIDELCNMTEDENSENKYMVVVLASVKHGGTDDSLTMRAYAGNQNRNTMFKNRKIQATYKRMYVLFDLNSTGKCGVMFESNSKDEQTIWRLTTDRHTMAVGDIMYIAEPHRITQIAAGNLFHITTDLPLVPVIRPDLRTMFTMPPTDSMTHFIMRGQTLNINQVTMVDSVCNGFFCDRQTPAATKCGCYTTTGRGSNQAFVFKVTVPLQFQTGKQAITMTSNRFTNLVFTNPPSAAFSKTALVRPHQIEIVRTHFRAINEHINANGGWDVAGWMRIGTLSEKDNPDDKVLAETFGAHIVYLFPSDLGLVDTIEFRALQLDPTTVG
jgi:hypothetical protein